MLVVGGGAVDVLEVNVLEAVALGEDTLVEPVVVEEAEGVGGEHDGAGEAALGRGLFVDRAFDSVRVESESDSEAA
jgi:hypothetical protein